MHPILGDTLNPVNFSPSVSLSPLRLKYIDKELGKKRGKDLTVTNQEESDLKRAEHEMYKIPDHLKVQAGETEAAKKLLHEKKLMGRTKTESNLPSSHSADYLQRGKDYAEKLRRDHPELYNRGGGDDMNPVLRFTDHTRDPPARRQAATDEIILDRFRKRERQHHLRR